MRSLDSNSMENFWGIIARQVYANNKQYDNLKELKQAILNEWSKVSETDLFRLCSSMSDRVFSVVELPLKDLLPNILCLFLDSLKINEN